jgi:hypothetical protein
VTAPGDGETAVDLPPLRARCARCGRPYVPEPVDFTICPVCERDLIGARLLGHNWRQRLRRELVLAMRDRKAGTPAGARPTHTEGE